MKILSFPSMAHVDPERWNRLGTDPLSRHEVLTALEEAELPGVSIRYAILEDGWGRDVAGLPLARIEIDGAHLTRGLFRRVIRGVRGVIPPFFHTSVLVCGTPLSVGNSPLRRVRGMDPGPILRHAAGHLEELADEEGVSWRVFKEFWEGELSVARVLEDSWVLAPSEPTSLLPLPWDSYPQYLADLRSSYRYKIRKSSLRLVRSGIQIDHLLLRDGYDVASHRLYENVMDRASVRLEHLTPRFFEGLGRGLGEAARLLRFSRESKTVGWVVLLVDGRDVYDLFHGIDYGENDRSDLYFNQLAETLRFSLANQARRLFLGQSTETAKGRFGARLEPRYLALKHGRRSLNGLLRSGSRFLFPSKPAPPPRRVFHSAVARTGAA